MTDKDGIIDLTDEVVESAPDDDTVIELTEVVSNDDEIIELSEAIDADADLESVIDLVEPLPTAEENVIDLVEPFPAAEEEVIDLADASGVDEAVDLLEEVGDGERESAAPPTEAWSPMAAEPAQPAAGEITPPASLETDVSTTGVEPFTEAAASVFATGEDGGSDDAESIESTTEPEAPEAVSPTPESDTASSESDLGDVVYFDDELEAGLEDEEKDDFVESLGMEIEDRSGEEADEDFESEPLPADSAGTTPEPVFPGLTTEEHAAAEIAVAQALAIPEDQLEAAIEKAVENTISGKIETILTQVVEKAVTQEIEKIKKALLDDLAD